MSAAIDVRSLTAGYDRLVVTRELELTVEAGEVVALLGPAGAGKTTTLLTIAGVLPPIGGTVSVLGCETSGLAVHRIARLGLAFVPQDRGLFQQLTVAENLRLRCRPTQTVTDDEVHEHFPALRPLMRRRTGLLSGGEQQMLALACALVAGPRVLLIDEMSLGLAPTLVERLLPIVRRIADETGMAVLIVEQHIHSVLDIADRAYVLSRGRVALSGSAAELRERSDLVEASYMGEAALHAPPRASSNGTSTVTNQPTN
jgi:branched-chain amino acid transport system ATP-binding protein